MIQVKIYDGQFQMCLTKMVTDRARRHEIMNELESYKEKKGLFGSTMAEDGMKTQQPSKHFRILFISLKFVRITS